MRILIIEDEKEIRDFLKENLKKENFVIDVAADGERGLFLATTNSFDLIILDNVLPKKNGYEVCKAIREDDNTVPILMLSGKLQPETKVKLLNAGADDYLTKPYLFAELLARIRALLRRPRQTENQILQIDDLILDPKNQIVRRGDNQFCLSTKKFMLLRYMMKNQDTVLSRAMIMEHVWDVNADPFSNTIETHILALRRIIDTPDKKKLIHTVSGRGYKIGLEE